MYQLLARLYGNNNLPDSSNMCHESTSVALPETIGVPVGTVRLEDFEHAGAIFFFGQNVGTNSPRMLHPLQEARERGVPVVTFNPIKEPGLLHFANRRPVTAMAPLATVSGEGNQLDLASTGDGNGINAYYLGNDGQLKVDQQGNGLGVTAYVTGDASRITASQSGFQHTADLTQNTAGNAINITQSGFSNHAVIRQ